MTHRDRLPSLHPARTAAGPTWEAWYQAASATQRHQALALARGGAVVPAHLLPGHAAPAPPAPCALGPLLTSDTPPPAFDPPPITPFDPHLTPCQCHAAARAIATPDVALILGAAGTGKSRVAAEILHQALARGERVLFASFSAAGTAAALTRLSQEAQAATIRLGVALGPLSLPNRMESLRRSAALARDSGPPDDPRADSAPEESASLLSRVEGQAAALAALRAERAALPETLEREIVQGASALGIAWRATQDETARLITPLTERLTAASVRMGESRSARAARQQERAPLTPLAEAKGRWWTLAFWQALFAGDVAGRLAALAGEDAAADLAEAGIVREEAEIRAAVDAITARSAEARVALIAAERQTREAAIDARIVETERLRAEAEAAWGAFWSTWLTEPPACTAEGREDGLARLDARREAEEEAAEARYRWGEALEAALPHLGPTLLAGASILAGPAEVLLDAEGPFGLLLVEEAHLFPEPLLLTLAQKCRRWALLGEPALPSPPLPGRPPRPPSVPFHILWSKLHSDPRDLSARWRKDGGRLIAALRPLDTRAPSFREPLFDRPEVEVCIGRQLGGTEDAVCEVSFPVETPVAEARSYIRAEMQELAVEPAGAAAYWADHSGAPALALCDDWPGGDAQAVPLLDGVIEYLTSCAGGPGCPGWRTAGLAFPSDWDRRRAREWAREKLGLADTGRTACLTRPHRAAPALAAFLDHVLYHGPCPVPAAHVEFLPVPRPEGKAGPANGRPRPARGAGQEIDLGTLRGPHPALSGAVRAALPPRGVVNPAEANAILGRLGALLADEAFLAEARAWGDGPAVAVLTPSPAQAALLRQFLSALLEGSSVDIVVSDAEGMRGRGCLAAVVSLVRSQGTEAPAFSEHPDDLAVLLTRAAGRLVLVGDPGSMARRGQWYGPLDHQGDIAGPQEQALMQALAGCWPEVVSAASSPDPGRAARVRESSSV